MKAGIKLCYSSLSLIILLVFFPSWPVHLLGVCSRR